MMSRARAIKPQFFTSDDVQALPIPARLTFVGLWLYADDFGNERLDADLIKANIWPREKTVSLKVLRGHLDLLAERQMIAPYTVNGKPYFHVANWETYQRVDRPSASTIPAPPRESLAIGSRGLSREGVGIEGGESRERGASEWEWDEAEEREEGAASRVQPSPFCKRHRALVESGKLDPDDIPPCRGCGSARLHFEKWQAAQEVSDEAS